MEKEKVSERAVLDYDGYKSVRSMLLSESKADRDVGLGILEGVDEKKCLPFILFTAYRASISEFAAHKKMAKYVFPVWLYVAVTGVIVYLMISPYY